MHFSKTKNKNANLQKPPPKKRGTKANKNFQKNSTEKKSREPNNQSTVSNIIGASMSDLLIQFCDELRGEINFATISISQIY